MVLLKLSIVAMCVVGVLAAETAKPVAEIITERSFVDGKGYHFDFKTSDGVSRQEEAQLITVGEHQGIGVKGSYSFTSPEGQEYEVTFTADENGFKPQIKIIGGTQ